RHLSRLVAVYFFVLPVRRPPVSPLFPYTTLFRSVPAFPRQPVVLLCRPRRRPPGRRLAATGAGGRPAPAGFPRRPPGGHRPAPRDRKSTRLNSSHVKISYAVFCLKKKRRKHQSVD